MGRQTTDLYEVLGVSPTASQTEIAQAYRRLVRELHPDMRPSDPAAAERFGEVSAAYAILRDPVRRADYDQSRRRAAGGGGRSIPVNFVADGRGGDGFRSDLLGASALRGESFFGGGGVFASPLRTWPAGSTRQSPRVARPQVEVSVDLADAVYGAEITVAGGAGLPGRVRIPAGVRDGQVLRVPGERGEIYLKVRVRAHPVYQRVGDDLETTVAVSFPEAVLGTTVCLPALRGEPLTVSVPAGTRSGTVLRLPGAGVRRSSGAGDLMLKVLIDVPEADSPRLRQALRSLGDLLPDPRNPNGGSPADAD